jgi:hypothetical protein
MLLKKQGRMAKRFLGLGVSGPISHAALVIQITVWSAFQPLVSDVSQGSDRDPAI